MTIGTIILYPTNAGNDVQNRALAGEIPMPKISRVTASNGVPHADTYNATTMTGDISIAATKQAEQVAVERLSDSAMRITAGFGPDTHLSITQIGVWLDDGTLFAYGPLPTAFEKGDGIGVALPMVLSRSALDQIQLDINILDVNALGAQLVAMVMARVLGLSNSVVMELLAPLSHAVKYSWLAGSQKFQIEMFGFGFTLLDIEPLDITGARARDDSLDLAESASTLLSGDYLVFDAANAEQVRLLPAGNLDQGRRRLQWDLLHTYPATAQLARTNWTITPGNATCPAGGVYFSGRVRLTDGDVHRVFVYGLTAPGAPTVDWRTDAGEFVPAVLLESRVHEGEWSEYAFEVPAGQYFHLRVTTPTATRIRAIVACNTLRGVRVVTPPTIVGNAARPGELVALALSAESRLVGGSVVQFDLVSAGLLTQHPATANAAVATLTLAGEAGEYRDIIATAVDDLGNRSLSIAHRIELRDDAAPAAPVILTPAANATGVSLTPTLTITAPLIAGESHASTDWQIRASNGVDVVWQALASAQLTSMTVSEALPANTELQVWVRGRGSVGTETAWGSRGFVTVASTFNVVGIVLINDTVRHGFWQRVDENFNPISTNQYAFDGNATYSGIVDQLIDGQYMVKIPKFYCRAGIVPSGAYEGKMFWMMSDGPKSGFETHPAFLYGLHEEYGYRERNQFWVGKYQASLSDNKLQSIPSVKPMHAQSLSSAWTEAVARNVDGVSGFMVWSWKQLSAIRLLMLIENGGCGGKFQSHGNPNLLGSNVNTSDPDVASQLDHGMVNVDHPLLAPDSGAGWRGIYGLWSNIGQVVSGIALNGSGVELGEGVDFTTYGYSPNANGWGGGGAPILYPQQVYDDSSNYAAGFDMKIPLAFLPSGYTNNISESVLADGVKTLYDHNAPRRVFWTGWYPTQNIETIGAWTTFIAHGPTASGIGLGARIAKY